MAGFQALLLEQVDGQQRASIQELSPEALPAGDVTIQVAYSSLNYKDGLAVTGKGKIVRQFPMVPGIDLAGTVVESSSPAYKPGEQVVLTGWGVGERYWGGFAQMARVKSEWLVPLPAGLSMQQAMAIGTAGLTAMLCVLALERAGLKPGGREVLVTGAGGGVGSVAVALLAKLGYQVIASTGRPEVHEYLCSLGAAGFIDRKELSEAGSKPLASERWGGAVDAVGGQTLANLLAAMAYGSSVAACGLAGGSSLPTTVLPFILRGVNLLGVDSVHCPLERRQEAWGRLATDLPAEALAGITQVVGLGEVPALSEAILQGQVRGRVVIDLHA
jgi:acrylyl-CoA reductase (NADPH)